jgi:mRNA-degrading endonuclease YafQ of YafQ-DinJ toxin-antitoxin module
MQITGFIRHGLFKKQFKKLSGDIQTAFGERAYIFLKQPYHILINNHPLHGERQGYWSINVTGSIRAVYKLQGSIAIFVEIGTHSELYDK